MGAVAATLVLTEPGRSQTPAPSVLASGATLTLVLDDALSAPPPKVGTRLHVHLQEPLVVGGITAAGANAGDHLRVAAVRPATAADPHAEVTLAVDSLGLGPVGKLPLALVTPTVHGALAAGQTIQAKTLGTLAAQNGALSLRIPLPFRLSDDPPYTDWTPIPLKTAAGYRKPTPKPSGTSASASPSPSPSGSPAPSSMPSGVSR